MFIATETGDLTEVEHSMKHVAGVELNVVTGLACLDLEVGQVSRVGNGSFGHFALQSLVKEGIGDHAVAIDSRLATGLRMKPRAENGTDPIVEYFRKDSAINHLPPDDSRADYFTSTRHLHLSDVTATFSESSYALLKYTVKVMEAEGKTLSFGPNLRPVLRRSEAEVAEKFNRLAFQVDQVLPGLREGMILTGQQTPGGITNLYPSRGVKAVVVRTDCDGAWFKSTNGEQETVDTIKVKNVVDTVGVGDGFTVGVISALLEGKAPLQAVSHGSRIGPLTIQVQGDGEGLPTYDALGE